MNKIEIIARRILGWKLNRWDRWFDYETGVFIPVSEFQPEQNLDHAMRIVDRLEKLGFTYSTNGVSMACFNDFCETGDTLAEAITNAAYSIADTSTVPEEWL
ncbi:hypothetical protein QNH20_15020 [Neobacillus sp. WH10]|uniref:BC1872 family protein n=1 Tax=Neobacillus sp. WH10 TaxID=3047873 RepID=UPI0024C1B1C4|nr:hypothetical protein [Neobacillus sp. WH10]WHY75452.1 hypothetical protein QNH20_15020 [Neobacillus sp. WH10]